MLQQAREGRSFSEGVLHLEGQEVVSELDQRIGRKVASTRIFVVGKKTGGIGNQRKN